MQILVTGGTGLIGRTLTSRLLALGHHVTVVTRNPEHARARLDAAVTLRRGWITSAISTPSTRSSTWRASPSPTSAGRRRRKSACARAAGR